MSRIVDAVLLACVAMMAAFVFLLAFSLGMLPAVVILLVLSMALSPLPYWLGAISLFFEFVGGLAAAYCLYRLLPIRVWNRIYQDLKEARRRPR